MIKIRHANIYDKNVYYKWSNDTTVRRNAFNNSLIEWDIHNKWFDNKLDDNNCFMYLFESDSIPVGQVRYDFNTETNIAEIDYSVDSEFRGMGLGAELIAISMAQLHLEINMPVKLIAKVKKKNIPSIKVFEKCKFEMIGTLNNCSDDTVYIYQKLLG